MTIRGPIPESIRKLMSPADRAPLGKAAMTNDEAQAKMDGKREKDLQENIAALLRIRGIAFFRQRMDRKTTGTVGWPDFTFAINGKAVAFEVKLPGEQPTPEQNACILAMDRNGWHVVVVHSEQQAIEQLEALSHG